MAEGAEHVPDVPEARLAARGLPHAGGAVANGTPRPFLLIGRPQSVIMSALSSSLLYQNDCNVFASGF